MRTAPSNQWVAARFHEEIDRHVLEAIGQDIINKAPELEQVMQRAFLESWLGLAVPAGTS